MNRDWARFWAVDLHVHTPGSDDAKDEDFGSAADVVRASIAAGLDCIAVTDHNTAAWCAAVAEAADGTSLVILPGFELSTRDGHLLGIWEEGTSPSVLEDVLIRVGITRNRFGDLNIVASKGMGDCAAEIREAGGIAIAAHIDKERGILTQPVQTHVNQLLSDGRISAFEYVLPDTPSKVAAKLGELRHPALIQSSDAYDASLSRHAATGIGIRRTWIKASRPDLCGLRHALDDPDLRVSLANPADLAEHPAIESVSISAGFLGGTAIDLSPDLNCLLGGTGAGKSLILEAIRFVLDQQVDASVFAHIRDEVDRRLHSAMRDGTEASLRIRTHSGVYRVSRVYSGAGSRPTVEQEIDGDWVRIDRDPSDLLNIAAFSQGEILEYARQPVGRVGLVDAQLDLADIEALIADCQARLKHNATGLIEARDKVAALSGRAAKAPELMERERELSALFDGDTVRQQGLWTAERGSVSALLDQVEAVKLGKPKVPDPISAKLSPAHDDKFERVRLAREAFDAEAEKSSERLEKSLTAYKRAVTEVQAELEAEFQVFKAGLDVELEKSGGTSLMSLRKELEVTQTELGKAQVAVDELRNTAQPALDGLQSERETLLGALKKARDDRRVLRRGRVVEINKQTAGFVKIDIPSRGDSSDFRAALDVLKVGSRVREQVLDLVAEHIGPYNFARALWTGDFAKVGKLPEGVAATDISRLHANVADRNLWTQLMDVQLVEKPDVLNVKFRKPHEQSYVSIEDLSHGQKCTAVLVILLADGESPVLIDQPEDALHAPWIEEYLVDRLRQLRGTRQYLFATRSPGLVVSADSEQLITMHASAGHGRVEASGSLERHDLNKLALHHLEGGMKPFARRAQKLQASILGNPEGLYLASLN